MAATLPSADDWEVSKENFQPLKAGRKPGALKDATAELRKQQLELQRKAFWEELSAYQGDDPLEVWLRFIKWTQESFSAGGHKAELLPLLERCTRELQGVEAYRTDVRYLRVWIQYADCLPDPADVFSFLKEKDIGQEHALYYIAFATYLEFRGNYARADSVYQQGINRLAAPVERLRAKYQEFQHRMARRIQRKAQEQSEQGPEPDHPERKTLGLLGGKRSASSRPLGGGLLGGGAAAGGLKRKADQENRAGGAGLDIFVDEEFSAEAPAQSAPAALFNPGRSAAGASWNKLAGFEATRKENMARPSVWAGQRIKQQAAHSAPAVAPLEIFVDPELKDAAASAGPAAGASGGDGSSREGSPKLSLRQRLDRPGGSAAAGLQQREEDLLADPLRLHKAQAARPPVPASRPQAPAGPFGPLAGRDAKRRREERLAFDESALTSSTGEELSFEEGRAAMWHQQQAAAVQAAAEAAAALAGPSQSSLTEASATSPSPAATEPAATLVVDEAAAAAAPEPTEEVSSSAVERHPGAAAEAVPVEEAVAAAAAVPNLKPTPFDQPAQQRSEAELVAEPTITINTRDAFAAINDMFKGTLGSSAATQMLAVPSAAMEPTVTISTKDAFAVVNQMFRGGLPAEAGGNLPLHPGTEPTMTFADGNLTISTKSAFAAINRMFKGALPNEHGTLPPTAFSEPTVTINTREAFAAINSMFGGGCSLQQPEAEKPAGEGGFPMPAPRPPRSKADAATQAAPLLDIREDAIYVQPAANNQPGAPEQGSGLFVREDTQFGFGSGAGATIAPPAGGGCGFSIREDTQFMTVPAPAPAASGGFSIREDTMFLQRQSPAPAAGVGGGFSIREDTQFIAVAAASPARSAGAAAGREAGVERADTGDLLGAESDELSLPLSTAGSEAGAGAGQVSKWGFAPGRDDTLALDLGDTQQLLGQALAGVPFGTAEQAAGAGAGGTTTGLTLHMEALQLSDKENIISQPAAAAAAWGRSPRDAGAALSTLQPLSAETASKACISVQADEEAEAALVSGMHAADGSGDLPRDDSFDVYADGDSPPLMGSPVDSDGEGSASLDQAHQPAREQSAAPAAAVSTVDPFRPSFQARMLASLDPPFTQWPGVMHMTPQEEAAAEAGFRQAAGSNGGLVELWLGGQEFAVSGCVGEGAYARVFQGVDSECADVALKVEAPPCPWEWYVLRALQGRLPEAARRLFIAPQALLLGERSSVLVVPFGAQGSLQAVLNLYLAQGQTPPEAVALHFAAELLRMLGHLHAARVLHADIKPDNLLVTLDPGNAGGDENAAPAVGLQLIDFGRSVDLELLPSGTVMRGDSDTDAFRCVEMRECRPWLWQADAYGVAAVVHCLLYGAYMEVERVQLHESGATFLRLQRPFKRQWAGDLWQEFFHALLNPTDSAQPPPVGNLLARLEAHLASRDVSRKRRQELALLAAMLQGAA